MTYKEAVKEITSEHKWYLGKYEYQGTAWKIVKRIEEDSASMKTIRKFLNKFDYREIEDSNWIKIETKVEKPNLKFS